MLQTLEPQQQIVVYARVGTVTAERHVCNSLEEAREAIEAAASEAGELAELLDSTSMVTA